MAYKLRVKTITVTTAGIPVAGPDLETKRVQILAPASNTGAVYYGSDGLTAGLYRSLAAGASDAHDAPPEGSLDLGALRFDAATSGDKVTLIYYEWQPTADPVYVTPKEVSGLATWWKADAISGLADGAAISSWADSSGNSKTLIGYTTGRPLYKTNVRNGLPGVLFDGVNDNFEVALTFGVFTVLWASNLTGAGNLWWGEGDTYADFIASDQVETDRGKPGFLRSLASDWMTGAKYFTVKMAATNLESRVRGGGVELPPAAVYPSADMGTASEARNLWIGSRDGDDPIAGHLFEMMVFNVALPLATIGLLEAYLKQKWGLD